MQQYTIDDAEAELRAAIDADDATLIARLEEVIDDLDKAKGAVTLHAAALWYAQSGLHIFPLQPGSKIPTRGSAGCKDATSDTTQVDAWWTETPTANIGIATGHAVDVIDIDGVAGVKAWAQMYDDLPPILGKVCTPRPGGNHLYVQAVPGRGNKAGLVAGVDYRGAGGYVVAPPSRITDGPNPGQYVWYQPLSLAGAEVGAK